MTVSSADAGTGNDAAKPLASSRTIVQFAYVFGMINGADVVAVVVVGWTEVDTVDAVDCALGAAGPTVPPQATAPSATQTATAA
ncbi:MAG TPA: hypothetical protein VM677_20920 [Actinokineospora sp.]|nr:hypothetical protein [Actinokineospora sp.]